MNLKGNACIGMFAIVTSLGVKAADTNQVPIFTHGPSIQAFRVSRERDAAGTLQDWRATILSAGAGYSFNFHPLCSSGCDTSWVTVGIPAYVSYVSSPNRFTLAPAISIGTLNNLFSIALGYALFDLAEGRESRGLLLGKLDQSLFYYTINVGFNFGAGTAKKDGAMESTANPPRPPFGFINL
jgi:hypothetical protein